LRMNMLCVLGMSHQTASMQVLEDFFLDPNRASGLHEKLEPSVEELIILQTCNRWECYISLQSEDEKPLLQAIKSFFTGRGSELDSSMYFKRDTECVRHLLEVTASLDSIVLGESQILGQVKEAYQVCRNQGWTGKLLNKLFETAVRGGKRVRTETGISRGAVSISQASVELGKKILGDLRDRRVLVVGAGEMGVLACRHLQSSGCEQIYLMNRTPQRAEEVCKRNGWTALPLSHLKERLFDVDMVISAVATPGYLLDAEQVQSLIQERRFKTLALIDISLPRSLDPALGKFPKVFLYDIDDLKGIVDENIQERRQQISLAEGIIEEEFSSFFQWCNQQDLVPAFQSIGKWKDEMVHQEMEKWVPKVSASLKEGDREVLRRLADSLANKLMHLPLQMLKECPDEKEDRERTLRVVEDVIRRNSNGS
jgi:glutamyl-tRNA reductase